MSEQYPCPCCRYLTRSEVNTGTFEICPICKWEDDDLQASDLNFEGGANDVSLNQARENYEKFGAIEERFISRVRKPLPDEIP